MRVLAVDPGQTTGFAAYDTDTQAFSTGSYSGQMQAIDGIWDSMLTGDVNVLVVEKFTITTATARKTRAGSNTAIEIIGALRWLVHASAREAELEDGELARRMTMVEQTPSEAKSFMTDEKLKRLGWYTAGPDHARDAARHLALYLVKAHTIPAEMLVASPAG